jgi:hypothetical protein
MCFHSAELITDHGPYVRISIGSRRGKMVGERNFRLKITHERHSPFVEAKKEFARSKTKIRQFSKLNIRFADKEL